MQAHRRDRVQATISSKHGFKCNQCNVSQADQQRPDSCASRISWYNMPADTVPLKHQIHHADTLT